MWILKHLVTITFKEKGVLNVTIVKLIFVVLGGVGGGGREGSGYKVKEYFAFVATKNLCPNAIQLNYMGLLLRISAGT